MAVTLVQMPRGAGPYGGVHLSAIVEYEVSRIRLNLYHELAPIISNEEELPGIFLLKLRSSQIPSAAKPGQFVMISSDSGRERLLRRPISLHNVINDEIHFLFAVLGKGTEWLSKRRSGEILDILGPVGNGFWLNANSSNILLAAGGMGIAPLVYLARQATQKGLAVKLLAGAKTAQMLLPDKLVPEKVEYLTATEDGSQGQRGLVTNLLEMQAGWADQIFICGPLPMYLAIEKNKNVLLGHKQTQVSLEVRMGCGMGICYSCTIRTSQGLKQACKDGPVFNLDEVDWSCLK